MNTRKDRTSRRPLCGSVVLCCAGLLGAATAHAGWLDGVLGPSQPATASAKQRVWQIRDFTRIELVAREAGSGANQQPVQIRPDALRQQLVQIQFNDRSGLQPLFADGEVGELVVALAQALGRAGPDDDVLLLSSSRRDGNVLASPTAVTARLFVQGGNLQLIVREARYEFYDTYRGTQALPRFSFGSRTAPGVPTLQSTGAANQRADWLSIPTAAQEAPVLAPAQPAVAPAARPALGAAGADDIERRLETLKRLREKGLITEDEYQQKRKEILQLL